MRNFSYLNGMEVVPVGMQCTGSVQIFRQVQDSLIKFESSI